MLAAPPTLGTGRLVCIDGPAGSGKTTLAGALRGRRAGRAASCTATSCCRAGAGCPAWPPPSPTLLAPLAAGEVGRWRRWDWLADDWAETHAVEPGGLLVLEGVGSWSPAIADLVGVLVWVEADARPAAAIAGIARDGEAMRAALGAVAARRGRPLRPRSAPARTPTWSSTPREPRSGRRAPSRW